MSGRQFAIADCVVALTLLAMSFAYGGVGAALVNRAPEAYSAFADGRERSVGAERQRARVADRGPPRARWVRTSIAGPGRRLPLRQASHRRG